MSNRKKLGGMILFLLVLGGSAPLWLKTSYHIRVKNLLSPPAPVKLFADGELLAEFEGPETQVQVRQTWVRWFHPVPEFSGQTLAPCGWREAPTSSRLTNDELLVYVGGGLRLDPFQNPDLILLVDNRQGPQTELAVGEVKLPVRADWSGRIKIPRPACEAVVRLNGREAGVIPQDPGVRALLLDVSGGHCYHGREVYYSQYVSSPPRRLLHRRLQGKRLYELHRVVSYFLRPAPDSVRTITGYEIRFVVSDCQ